MARPYIQQERQQNMGWKEGERAWKKFEKGWLAI